MLARTANMAIEAKQLYDNTIRTLPAKERLALAALILEDLASNAEFDDSWTEQDIRDLAAFSLSVAPTHDSDKEPS